MRRPSWVLFREILRRVQPPGDVGPRSDADLLDRFARTGDEAAFELLLWRHARLVMGVCRRTLRDEHLAEDAFQATFLILARKAGSVRRSGSVAGWLHRVARRVAARAAVRRAMSVSREGLLATDPEDRRPGELPGELRAVLDAEVNRLPDRFRLPVVLCYLDGRSTEEAARILGVPRGTVLSRLATARQRLAGRLSRRGLAPVLALGISAVSDDPGAAAERVERTLRVALAYLTQPRSLPLTGPVLLAREVIRMSAWKKVPLVVFGLLSLAVTGTGIGIVAGAGPGKPVAGVPAEDNPKQNGSPAPDATSKQAAGKQGENDLRSKLRSAEEAEREIDRAIQVKEHRLSESRSPVPQTGELSLLTSRLARTEAKILDTEDAIAKSESFLRDQEDRVRAILKKGPTPEQLSNISGQDQKVVAARKHVDELRQWFQQFKKITDNLESSCVKKAQE